MENIKICEENIISIEELIKDLKDKHEGYLYDWRISCFNTFRLYVWKETSVESEKIPSDTKVAFEQNYIEYNKSCNSCLVFEPKRKKYIQFEFFM